MAGKQQIKVRLVDADGSVLDNIETYMSYLSKGYASIKKKDEWWPHMPADKQEPKAPEKYSDQPVCSPLRRDPKNYGEKVVKTSSKAYKALQKRLLNMGEGMSLGYMDKDIVCICQYILENLEIVHIIDQKPTVTLPASQNFEVTLQKAVWLCGLDTMIKLYRQILTVLYSRKEKFVNYKKLLENLGIIGEPNAANAPNVIAKATKPKTTINSNTTNTTNVAKKNVVVPTVSSKINVQSKNIALSNVSKKSVSVNTFETILARLKLWIVDRNKSIDDLLLKDLFRIKNKPSFLGAGHEVNVSYPYSDHPRKGYTVELRDALYNYILIEKLRFQPTQPNRTAMMGLMDMFNPWTCTIVPADLLEAPPVQFLDTKLGDIVKFANLHKTGHCYSTEYYGQAILSNYGFITFQHGLKLNDPKNPEIRKHFISHIIPAIGAHYASLPSTDITKQDFIRTVTKTLDRKLLFDLLSTTRSPHVKLVFEPTSNPVTQTPIEFRDGAFDDVSAVTALFTILFTEYGKITMHDNLKKVYDELGEGVFNMMALIGYIFTSDNLYAQKGTTHDFHVSLACAHEWSEFRKALDTIVMRKDNTQTVTQFLDSNLQIAVNNTNVNFEGITDDVIGSCIHGAGQRIICRYLSAYHHLQTKGATAELAPFFIMVPPHLKIKGGPMEGMDYLSCCNDDKFMQHNNCNPVNTNQLIMAYQVSPDGNTVSVYYLTEILNIASKEFYAHKKNFFSFAKVHEYVDSTNGSTQMILPYGGDGGPVSALATTTTAALCLPQNRQMMIDLLRIPALFTKQRKLNFMLYRDYVVHSYRLVHNIAPSSSKAELKRYARWKATIDAHNKNNANTNTLPYDIAESAHVRYTERGPHEMLRSFLAYKIVGKGGEKRIKYMLNADYNTSEGGQNANSANADNYDIMNNFFEVEYGKGGRIPHPINPSKDMTRAYQYLTILGKMLSPKRIFRNVCIIDSTSTLEQCQDAYRLVESYYGMFNQAFTTSNTLFNQLESAKIENGVTTQNITKQDLNHAVHLMSKKSLQERALYPKFASHLHLLKVVENATIFNADKMMDAFDSTLSHMSEKTIIEITPDLKIVFEMEEIMQDEIQTNMTMFVGLMFCVLPNFDLPGHRAQFVRAVTHMNNLYSAPTNKSFFLMFWRALAFMTTTFVCGEGNLPSTFQFHFTEIMRDARFYVELNNYIISKKVGAVPVADVRDHSLLGMTSDKKLTTAYDRTRYYLQEKVAYYKEGVCQETDSRIAHHTDKAVRETMRSYKDVSLIQQKEDYQDSIPVVFEAFMKADLVSAHRDRFMQLRFVQNFIDRYILGEPMLNVTGEFRGEPGEFEDPHFRTLHIDWIIKGKFGKGRVIQPIIELAKLVAEQVREYATGGLRFDIGNS